MYWGAADEARSDAEDPKRRVRRLGAVVAVTLLSIGGTVAMASASPGHATADPSPVAVASYRPAPASGPESMARTTVPETTAPTTPATTPPTTPSTTTPPTTAAPPPRPAPAPRQQAVASALQTRSTTPAAPALASANTCGAALAYLGAHSAPGFRFECPGNALGHQAMTCVDVAGVCPGYKLIVISVVCPASYMNEAHNSWILSGLTTGAIDPYGYCH